MLYGNAGLIYWLLPRALALSGKARSKWLRLTLLPTRGSARMKNFRKCRLNGEMKHGLFPCRCNPR